MSIASLTAPIDDNIRRPQEDNPLLQHFRNFSAIDTEYQELIPYIKTETSLKETKKLPQTSTAFKYLSVWNRLALLDESADRLGTMDKYQIIVPEGDRKEVLDHLHIPHQIQIKTYMAATTHYYWPQIKQEVIQTVETCPLCREFENDQPVGPPVYEDILQRNLEPFKRLCLDQFMANNTQYLVAMDLFSGYLFILDLGKKTFATQVAMEIE